MAIGGVGLEELLEGRDVFRLLRFAVGDKLRELLLQQLVLVLKARDEAFEKEFGVPMTAVGLSAELEKIRLEDLEKYENRKTRKKALFHKWFRQIKD